MTAVSLREEASKIIGLEIHLKSNFFPPHPSYVIESTIEGFKKYWDGELTLEKLKEACYLRDMDGLYKYYGEWLDE